MLRISLFRFVLMLLFAAPALLFSIAPFVISLVALSDIEHWYNFALGYACGIILALIFTGLVYLARNFDFGFPLPLDIYK